MEIESYQELVFAWSSTSPLHFLPGLLHISPASRAEIRGSEEQGTYPNTYKLCPEFPQNNERLKKVEYVRWKRHSWKLTVHVYNSTNYIFPSQVSLRCLPGKLTLLTRGKKAFDYFCMTSLVSNGLRLDYICGGQILKHFFRLFPWTNAALDPPPKKK